jgi:hypothetical protein
MEIGNLAQSKIDNLADEVTIDASSAETQYESVDQK